MTRAVQHSAETDDWHTPPAIIEAARELMGGIDFDPASSAEANARVKATEWIGRPRDGLQEPWRGRVFLNPPGGKRLDRAHSPAALWFRSLALRWQAGAIKQATFVIFNLETIRYVQAYECPQVPDFPICWLRERPRFLYPDGTEGKSPGHPGAMVWLPPVAREGTERYYDPRLHGWAQYQLTECFGWLGLCR